MISRPKKIPTHPGVYIFRRGMTPLYVGKALNIRKRLVSYFQNRANLPPKTAKMLDEATNIKFIRTKSEIEALLEETKRIKELRPKYNVLMRDDKNYFYVAITNETYPRIFVTHQPFKERIERREKGVEKNGRRDGLRTILYSLPPRYIGPFTDGTALYTTLKLLRRIFPYCTCKEIHKRPCLASEIGKCPGYCCLDRKFQTRDAEAIHRKRYRNNIRNIIEILSSKRTRLLDKLKREMKEAAKREQYERAAVLRDQVFGLEGIFEHSAVLRTPKTRYAWPMVASSLEKALKIARPIQRIEGYDISNISGTEATGSMVVFVNGSPDKQEYRKFKIKTVTGSNDVAMHQEVIRRRLNHNEWPLPDIMVIDGGKGQLNAVMKVIRESRIWNLESRPLITALAKQEEILFRENGPAMYLKRSEPSILHLFQQIRDESHRFARNYHHKLREKQYRASVA